MELPELDPVAASAELTVPVDGTEQDYPATVDLDGDGHPESLYVEPTEDSTPGGYVYSDTSGDGVADTLTQFGADGAVLERAGYDPETGEWRQLAADDPSGRILTVDTPHGPIPAALASYDTDGDGVRDTAVISTADGTTLVVTDADGDGAADVLTEVSSDGSFSSLHHTGVGQWTEVDSGNLAGNGAGADADPPVLSPVTTDPATGRWTPT